MKEPILLNKLLKENFSKFLAVLIDPDVDYLKLLEILEKCVMNKIDFIFIGGSIINHGNFENTIKTIKEKSNIPVYIFPGNEMMISKHADGILFLSLLSGRNPEYLIGKHVIAAPSLVQSGIDIVSTAYILIDGGRETSVSYISNTKPIPSDKIGIAVSTALAGKLMGMSIVYADAGSGSVKTVSKEMVKAIKENCKMPLIIGGGIRDYNTALDLYKNGANMLVIGNGTEENDQLIEEISKAKLAVSESVNI